MMLLPSAATRVLIGKPLPRGGTGAGLERSRQRRRNDGVIVRSDSDMSPGLRPVPRSGHGNSTIRTVQASRRNSVARSPVQFPVPPSRSRTLQLPVPTKQLTVPTNDAKYHTYRSDLSLVRALVFKHASAAGLTVARANDLVLAVSEVAANTLRHTQSPGTLAIWHDDREVVCEIRDEGTITDPHVGKRKPPPDASGGHGLWLVRQVCDLVELTSDANGTTVRMHMALRPSGLTG